MMQVIESSNLEVTATCNVFIRTPVIVFFNVQFRTRTFSTTSLPPLPNDPMLENETSLSSERTWCYLRQNEHYIIQT